MGFQPMPPQVVWVTSAADEAMESRFELPESAGSALYEGGLGPGTFSWP